MGESGGNATDVTMKQSDDPANDCPALPPCNKILSVQDRVPLPADAEAVAIGLRQGPRAMYTVICDEFTKQRMEDLHRPLVKVGKEGYNPVVWYESARCVETLRNPYLYGEVPSRDVFEEGWLAKPPEPLPAGASGYLQDTQLDRTSQYRGTSYQWEVDQRRRAPFAVSYTHLTLPTKRIV